MNGNRSRTRQTHYRNIINILLTSSPRSVLLRAWAINQRVKNWVCNLRYGPQTRLVRGRDIKLVFAPHKIKNLYSTKDVISKLSRSRVNTFSCAGYRACYVGETNRHLATSLPKQLTSHRNSHIYGSETYKAWCSKNCYSILNTASTSFQLKIKEEGGLTHR